MGVDKYAFVMQMYAYYYCNNQKMGKILSEIFFRTTSKVLLELSMRLSCKLSSMTCLWRGGGASAVCLASQWYLRLDVLQW